MIPQRIEVTSDDHNQFGVASEFLKRKQIGGQRNGDHLLINVESVLGAAEICGQEHTVICPKTVLAANRVSAMLANAGFKCVTEDHRVPGCEQIATVVKITGLRTAMGKGVTEFLARVDPLPAIKPLERAPETPPVPQSNAVIRAVRAVARPLVSLIFG